MDAETHVDDVDHEDAYVLMMMKALDGRLHDEEERRLWEAHLKENPERAREFARFTTTATYMNDFRERQLYAHHNRTSRTPNRTIFWVGLGCLLVGLGLIWAFALGPNLITPGSWIGMELGAIVAAVGGLILAVKLVRR